jgi:hypothetical protein
MQLHYINILFELIQLDLYRFFFFFFQPMGKNAIIDMNLRWPSSIIPYVISASFGELISWLLSDPKYNTRSKEFNLRNAGINGTPLVAIVSVTHE